MKIPKTLKIGGFDWAVETSKDVTNQGNCFGATHHRTQKIFLEDESTCGKQKVEHTLLHEVMHAVWWQQGLTETDADKYEELVVTAMSMGLYQALKDNKINFGG